MSHNKLHLFGTLWCHSNVKGTEASLWTHQVHLKVRILEFLLLSRGEHPTFFFVTVVGVCSNFYLSSNIH